MSATVTIRRWVGSSGSPTKTNITGINTRANAEDAHTTAGTSNSILIPSSGTNYSFWVCTRLSVDAITGGTVDNIRWYADTGPWGNTGVTAKVAKTGGSVNTATYAQATGTTGTSGTQLTVANYGNGTTDLAAAPVDVFTYSSGSPLTVAGSLSATGDLGQFVVYQIEVGTSASSGPTNSHTFTYKYDDTSS